VVNCVLRTKPTGRALSCSSTPLSGAKKTRCVCLVYLVELEKLDKPEKPDYPVSTHPANLQLKTQHSEPRTQNLLLPPPPLPVSHQSRLSHSSRFPPYPLCPYPSASTALATYLAHRLPVRPLRRERIVRPMPWLSTRRRTTASTSNTVTADMKQVGSSLNFNLLIRPGSGQLPPASDRSPADAWCDRLPSPITPPLSDLQNCWRSA